MAKPSVVEIQNMKVWSLHGHYFKNRSMYVAEGRAIAAGIRAILQKSQPQTSQSPPPTTPTVQEADIAAGFLSFLNNDKNWTAYLGKKGHMTATLKVVMTDTMARFIAWEAYVDITK